MNSKYERQFAERMRNNYSPGTRLELISMDDPYSKILPGTRGTVVAVDDIGTIHQCALHTVLDGWIPVEYRTQGIVISRGGNMFRAVCTRHHL